MDTTNLIAYLPFDDDATTDLCGNTWTAYGSPTVGTSGAISGKALQLDGASYLQKSGSISLGGKDFTICGWAKMDSNGWYDGIVAINNKQIRICGVQTYTDRLLISIKNNETTVTGLNLTSRFHWEIDYTHSNGKWLVFFNGNLIRSYTSSLSRTTYATLLVGSNGDTSPASPKFLHGTIDEFQIYDGVALHTANFTPPTAEDYAEKPCIFSADLQRKISRPRRPSLGYLSFTGQAGSYAELPLSVLPGATTFTIEIKLATTSTKTSSNYWQNGHICAREISGNWKDDFGLYINGGQLCFWAEPVSGGSSATGKTISNAIINDGVVNTVAVVSSNGAIDLYCDGVNVAHTDNVNAKITNTQTILLASNSDSQSYLQMDLYEARFWSTARTQEQIFADIDGAENGLEAWYLPSSLGLGDYSGNCRTATLYGNPIYTPLSGIVFKPEAFMSWIPIGSINFKPEVFMSLIDDSVLVQFNADLSRNVTRSENFPADIQRKISNRVEFSVDLQRTVERAEDFTVDLQRRVDFAVKTFTVDLQRKITKSVEITADLQRTLTETTSFTADTQRDVVHKINQRVDLQRKIVNVVEFSSDLQRSLINVVELVADLQRSLYYGNNFTVDLQRKSIWQWLTRILPESSFLDPKMYASAESLDYQITKFHLAIREVLFLSRLDELSGTVLDLLAEQFHVDYYDAINFSDEEKRNLIRQSIAWHRLKGTPAAVEMVLQDAFKDLRIDEWFNYGGEPYHFRLWTKGYKSTPERFKSFWLMFLDAKNVRSQLEKVIIDHSHEDPIKLYTGVAKVVSGLKTMGLPRPKDIKLNLYNGVAIVKTGKKIIGLPRPKNLHGKIYSGVLKIVTGTVYLGMKRNPF